MSFRLEIAKQNRAPKRPALATGLFLHVIAANPFAENAVMDPRWAEEHARVPRFRIGGTPWFRDLTLLKAEALSGYSKKASNRAKSCGWTKMEDLPRAEASNLYGEWESIAKQQYYAAIQQRPVTFVKAVLFILSCELALQEIVDRQKAFRRGNANPDEMPAIELPREVSSGEFVYRHLAIIPACWNINDFNAKYLETRAGEDAGFLEALGGHTEQSDIETFHPLAAGHTVTYRLAERVKQFCDDAKPHVGQIRCRAGRGVLGSKRATHIEELAA